jgi:hypothetical protein
VEPVVPVVAEASIERKVIPIEGTATEPLNTSADHRRSDHPASMHRVAYTASTHSATPKTTAVGSATAAKTTTVTAASKTTTVTTATAKTTAVATAAAAGHSGRAHAQCRNGH